MEECWKYMPRDLLTYVFRYIGHRYIKTEIIRWMSRQDVVRMIGDTPFEHFVRERNITGCILYKRLYPRRKINWYVISQKYRLSETFINIYHNHLDWYWLSCKQNLTEVQMDAYCDKLDWWWISLKQNMSESFKEKYKNKIIKRLCL